MRAVCLAAVATLALSAGASANEGKGDACAERLERTLKVMESRAPMKDEVATSLMWLRMDAAEALQNGKTATCEDKVSVVENVLNVSPNHTDLKRTH